MLPNETVDLLFVDERPTGVQVDSAVDLAVPQTDPGLKGDTASGGGSKPATLETGVVVQVPLFVNEGDRVRVDTRTRRVRLPRLARDAFATPARRSRAARAASLGGMGRRRWSNWPHPRVSSPSRCDQPVAGSPRERRGVVRPPIAGWDSRRAIDDAMRRRPPAPPPPRRVRGRPSGNPPWQGRLFAAVKACGTRRRRQPPLGGGVVGFARLRCRPAPGGAVARTRPGRHPRHPAHRADALSSGDRPGPRVPVTAARPHVARPRRPSPMSRPCARWSGALRGSTLIECRQLNEALARLGRRRGSRRLGRVIATGPAPTPKRARGRRPRPVTRRAVSSHPDVNKPLVVHGRRIVSRLPLAARAAHRRSRRRRLARRRRSHARTTPSARRFWRLRASESSASPGPSGRPASPDAGANSRRWSTVAMTAELPGLGPEPSPRRAFGRR